MDNSHTRKDIWKIVFLTHNRNAKLHWETMSYLQYQQKNNIVSETGLKQALLYIDHEKPNWYKFLGAGEEFGNI